MKALCLLILLVAVVPRGYAKLPLSSLMSMAQVEGGGKLFGQNGWLRKHLRAGGFALGILITTCTGLGCNNNHSPDDMKLASNSEQTVNTLTVTSGIQLDYDHVEAADSLLSVLADIRGKQEKLYFYTRDDETRIGWLLGEIDKTHFFTRYRSPDNRPNFGDVLSLTTEMPLKHLRLLKEILKDTKTIDGEEAYEIDEFSDGLGSEGISIFSNDGKMTLNFKAGTPPPNWFHQQAQLTMITVGGEVVDIVSEDHVVGQIQSSGYPGFDYAYQDPDDGTRKHVTVVATFVADDSAYHSALENILATDSTDSSFSLVRYPRYVVLVTLIDGHELANDSKYFKVVDTKHLSHLPH